MTWLANCVEVVTYFWVVLYCWMLLGMYQSCQLWSSQYYNNYYVPFWGSIYHPLFKASAVLVKDNKLTILTKTGFSILDDFQNQVLRIEFQELGFKNQTLFKEPEERFQSKWKLLKERTIVLNDLSFFFFWGGEGGDWVLRILFQRTVNLTLTSTIVYGLYLSRVNPAIHELWYVLQSIIMTTINFVEINAMRSNNYQNHSVLDSQ